MRLLAATLLVAACAMAQLSIRPVVRGPLRVAGNKLVDAEGSAIVLQGSQAPIDLELRWAGTMFSTIRQRWNMNTVRVPVRVATDETDPTYIERTVEIVRRANQAGLLVIVAAREDGADLPTERSVRFWRKWAARFQSHQQVIFDLFDEPSAAKAPGHRDGVRLDDEWRLWQRGGMLTSGERTSGMQALVVAVRESGARQPVVAMVYDDELLMEGFDARWALDDPAVIYEVCPTNRRHQTDAARQRAFGFAAERIPLLATGWDPALGENGAECQSLPGTPKAVEALAQSHMNYFDARGISWIASSFTPGRMIHSMQSMEPTEMLIPFQCGSNDWPAQGIGLTVQLHQWSMTRDNLITVSAGAGSIEVPAGGLAIGYADIGLPLTAAETSELPTTLAGLSVHVTDSTGVTRLAPIVSLAIGQVTFQVDPATASGMASVEAIWNEGRRSVQGCIIVVPMAPGLFSAFSNARGPAVGDSDAEPLSECDAITCWTVPVRAPARIRVVGSGFRTARQFRATLGGREVTVADAGPQPEYPFNDQLLIDLPDAVRGMGEEDLVVFADGKVSNVVRLAVE